MSGTAMREAALIFEAGDFLRARGAPVTARKVESYVRAQQATNTHRSTSMAGKKREFLEPRRPDGSGGKDVLTVQMQPAQQYAEPQDYFAEPRLSAAKKAEAEARLRGLETEMQSAGLTPVQVIRLEQEAEQLRRILGKANEQGATRTFAR